MRVPWTARRSNQSILKEISPEYSLEGLMLKLKHFGHLLRRADSLERTLMLGKIEGRRRRGASGPITSWEIEGETVATVADFIFWAPKSPQMVTHSHEIKRCLLLGRKVMINLDSILKSRDYFADKSI